MWRFSFCKTKQRRCVSMLDGLTPLTSTDTCTTVGRASLRLMLQNNSGFNFLLRHLANGWRIHLLIQCQIKYNQSEWRKPEGMFVHTPTNCPILHWTFVVLTVRAYVFSMAWHKIVKRSFLIVPHELFHETLVFSLHTQSPKGSCVYQTNWIQVTRGMAVPWYTTRKHCIISMFLHYFSSP